MSQDLLKAAGYSPLHHAMFSKTDPASPKKYVPPL